jgi:hypothetical protein
MTTEGTPQGAGISPLLANIFLHYVLDLWVHQWRKRKARGRVIIVRYADDFVMGFQHDTDAPQMWTDLRERLSSFKLSLHRGEDASHRVRQALIRTTSEARIAAMRDVLVPRLHARLRAKPKRALHREASDRPQAVDPEASRHADRNAATDARARGSANIGGSARSSVATTHTTVCRAIGIVSPASETKCNDTGSVF